MVLGLGATLFTYRVWLMRFWWIGLPCRMLCRFVCLALDLFELFIGLEVCFLCCRFVGCWA